ncbi:MAG: hypothetical protein V2A62_00690 [Candidatus Woesearchaeota archaeon]
MADEDPHRKKSIADIAREVEALDLIKGTPVYESILRGRLAGYTPKNCPHPLSVMNGPYIMCTQCGDQELT